jgi:hypothetical protein
MRYGSPFADMRTGPGNQCVVASREPPELRRCVRTAARRNRKPSTAATVGPPAAKRTAEHARTAGTARVARVAPARPVVASGPSKPDAPGGHRDRTSTGPCRAHNARSEAVARIGFGVAAPQDVEVGARRHPTCWGVDDTDRIRATSSSGAVMRGRERTVVLLMVSGPWRSESLVSRLGAGRFRHGGGSSDNGSGGAR